jgi:purine-binding chemotaxis protein CheW
VEAPVSNSARRFLTFLLDEQLYALQSQDVAEVIRVPELARVPQGPAALLGIANLRGSVLPVAGLREILGRKAAARQDSERAIVLDVGAPVALVVDSVANLETITLEQLDSRQAQLSTDGAENLLGAFSTGAGKPVAKILNVKALLEAAFSSRSRAKSQERPVTPGAAAHPHEKSTAVTEKLVTFEVAGQEFALPLEVVQEILPAPDSITAVARAEAVVLGITSVRNTLLPLLSLRGLLGFNAADAASGFEKVVVVRVGNAEVGLVADRARAILSAELAQIDPVPPVLAARVGGESRVKSVYRGDAGRRLISILSPEQLFREDVMKRLAANTADEKSRPARRSNTGATELIVLVFRLGDDEFGLPIDSVVEVAHVPTQITRVPKTPKFLEGVVNLRGEVLPVIDQRRRFDMPKLENTQGRRLVVVKTERLRAGLIVDSVLDVLRTESGQVEPPPELTEATSRLVRGVINLDKAQRMVLLLDPTELLTRAEQGVLDTFQSLSNKANA